MSKPKNIFLIRHGESQGNVNKTVYSSIPDYAINLTDKGKEQAKLAGEKLRATVDGSFFFYISSYHRTRMTFEGIAKSFQRDDFDYREDPRITEQSWSGALQPNGYDMQAERDREKYGHFYYRFAGGESNVEVYTRISSFLDTMHRDFEKIDYPENCAIIMHGMSMRVFLMRWFHLTVEEFEEIRNPKNCEIIQLSLQEDGRYKLVTEIKKYPHRTHSFQYPLDI